MAFKAITQIIGALCACLIFATASTAFAQLPTPYGPGDPVSFTVSFDGEGAKDVSSIDVRFNLGGRPADDQPGFAREFDITSVTPLAPGKFKVFGKIPTYVASGTFKLTSVFAGPSELGNVWDYEPVIPELTIVVRDDKHFAKPNLKGVEINPRP